LASQQNFGKTQIVDVILEIEQQRKSEHVFSDLTPLEQENQIITEMKMTTEVSISNHDLFNPNIASFPLLNAVIFNFHPKNIKQ